MSLLIICRACGWKISTNAATCPRCREPRITPFSRLLTSKMNLREIRRIALVALVLMVAGVIVLRYQQTIIDGARKGIGIGFHTVGNVYRMLKSEPESKVVITYPALREDKKSRIQDQPYGSKTFEDNNGLVWTADANTGSQPMNWETAQNYIARLNKKGYGGYDGWRLPTAEELKALSKSMADYQGSIHNVQKEYITATVPAGYSDTVGSVEIKDGHVWWHPKSYGNNYVWPVCSAK